MSNIATIETQPKSILMSMASRYGMEPAAFEQTLRATVVPKGCSKEQFAAFLLVAKEYDLNPITKEIYAFPSRSGGIQPIVGIDGWMSIINDHPDFDGMEFEDSLEGGEIVAITCRIHRKGRSHPVAVTEYMSECKRDTDPWKKWPARMLRHKAAIQCARYAFGFSGILDPDEADRGEMRDITPPSPPPAPASLSAPSAPAAAPAPKQRNTGKRGEREAVPYAEMAERQDEQHDPDTGEIVDVESEEFDADKWLDGLDAAMAVCTDQDTLEEVWNEQGNGPIEAGLPFPPDMTKAEDLYQKHIKRIEKEASKE